MNFEKVLAWWGSVTSAFTRALTPGQLVSLIATFIGVVGLVVGAAYWISTPTYRVLFSDMDPESAATVVDDLRASDVPFELDPGGRTVRVPMDRLDELRLEFASEGQLPSSGRIGFEIFDRTAFGATEFLEQVNFRRALEGEISRTIATLSEVTSARVHIAQAQQPLFGVSEQEAKASVVLTLRNNRPLRAETTAGIANLVAASVEGLQTDAVVIVDSFGRALSRLASGEEEVSGHQEERRQQFERSLATRVVQLLELVVGAGRVRANVAATFTSSSAEETEELWDPDRVAIRSRYTTGDSGPAPMVAGGVAGALPNLPPPPVEEGESDGDDEVVDTGIATSPTGVQSSRETTNYEISKSVSRTLRPGGDVARLSVAVVLDDQLIPSAAAEPSDSEPPVDDVDPTAEEEPAEAADADSVDVADDVPSAPATRPWAPEDLEKIRGLVAAAVGLDPTRGDQLTVENIAFETPVEEVPESLPFWQRFSPQLIEALRILGVLILAVLGIMFGVRPIVGRVTAALPPGRPAAAALGAGTPPATSGQQDMQAELQSIEGSGARGRLDVLSNRVTELSQQQPENAARLLRAWLDEDRR